MAQNNNNPATQDLNEIVRVRHEKLAALKESGNNPFLITKFDFNNDSANIKANFQELEGKTVTIKAKAGSNGKLFGQVTSKEIASEIAKTLGIEIDRKKMSVADIKNFGEYTAEIKLYTGITAKITVKVTE